MPQHSVAYLLFAVTLACAELLARQRVRTQVATAFRHGVDFGTMLAARAAPASVEADR